MSKPVLRGGFPMPCGRCREPFQSSRITAKSNRKSVTAYCPVCTKIVKKEKQQKKADS